MSGLTRSKMVLIFVGDNTIYNTTSWLAYASWTWEVMRRNPDYMSYYKSLRNKGLSTEDISENISLIRASQHFPTANKQGLLFPADPDLDAGKQAVFWNPTVFKTAVRFHVVEKDEINRKNMPIQLSQCHGIQTHYLDADETYHIRFLGEKFWFQIYCDNLQSLDPDAYIGLEFNHIANRKKRFQTFEEISGLYDGSIAPDAALHVPASLLYHQRSLVTYDVRTAGGTLTDAILAMKKAGLLDEASDEIDSFMNIAKFSYKRAKAHIYGDYLKILERQ